MRKDSPDMDLSHMKQLQIQKKYIYHIQELHIYIKVIIAHNNT